jgi:hypothetical protein
MAAQLSVRLFPDSLFNIERCCMKLSRRTFTSHMLGSLLTFSLVKSLDKVDVLAKTVEPIVRKWLIEMEHVTEQLRQGRVKTIEWQTQIESLLSRVDLNDLLSAIDYDRLAKTAVFPEDHESAEDVDFSHNEGLPAELSFCALFLCHEERDCHSAARSSEYDFHAYDAQRPSSWLAL